MHYHQCIDHQHIAHHPPPPNFSCSCQGHDGRRLKVKVKKQGPCKGKKGQGGQASIKINHHLYTSTSLITHHNRNSQFIASRHHAIPSSVKLASSSSNAPIPINAAATNGYRRTQVQAQSIRKERSDVRRVKSAVLAGHSPRSADTPGQRLPLPAAPTRDACAPGHSRRGWLDVQALGCTARHARHGPAYGVHRHARFPARPRSPPPAAADTRGSSTCLRLTLASRQSPWPPRLVVDSAVLPAAPAEASASARSWRP